MKLNLQGFEFIKQWEGLRLLAYQCSAGVWTIGIGSTKYTNGKSVEQGDRLDSEDEAYELFKNTIQPYEDAVNRYVTEELTQNQFNALVSFTYNVGIEGFRTSTLLKVINRGIYAPEVINYQFSRWNKADGKPVVGLTNRRKAEAELFFTGSIE